MNKRTNKTSHVLSLISQEEDFDDVENPILNETFKNLNIHTPKQEDTMVNINKILISENIDEALARFKICGCSKCRDYIEKQTLSKLPEITAMTISDGEDKINKLKILHKKELVFSLVHTIIKLKISPIH